MSRKVALVWLWIGVILVLCLLNPPAWTGLLIVGTAILLLFPPLWSRIDANGFRTFAAARFSCAALITLLVVVAVQHGSEVRAQSAEMDRTIAESNALLGSEQAMLHPDAPAPENSKSAQNPAGSPWTYGEREDKVRGGTMYYASTLSTNSVAQSAPYDADTRMRLAVRKSPAAGTDVILSINSGQMLCPSYEGCSGTVRFDSGAPEHVRFAGPADDSSDTIFVVGAKHFIAKLKSAKKLTVEKTLYEAGSPQFEFDVHGLRWEH